MIGCVASPAGAGVSPDDATGPHPIGARVAQDGPPFERHADGRAIDGQFLRAPLPERLVRIAVLPDRTTGRDWGLPALERAVADLERMRPDAVFCVGDLVQGYTRDEATWHAEVDAFIERIAPIADRFYPTAGNHDVIGGARDPGDTRFRERYRERFGPLHYAVEVGGTTMVVLFSDENLSDDAVAFGDAQLAWLSNVLRERAGTPIVVLMHRPLWRYRGVEWWERVHPLLAAAEVDAVVAGHFHALQRDETRDGVAYHVLGVCGGMIDQHPFTGQLDHLTFLLVDRDAERGARVRVHHQVVGATLPEDFVLASDQNLVFRLKTDRDVLRLEGALPDVDAGLANGSLRAILRNPIDRPITVRLETGGARRYWPVEGESFLSRTPANRFNPFTTVHVDPGHRLRAIDGVDPENWSRELEPGERIVVPLSFDVLEPASRTAAPIELHARATFRDSHGRDVPIVVRRRTPIARAAMPIDEARTFGLHAWRFSVYETLEPDPRCRIEARDAEVSITVSVSGDRRAWFADPRPLGERLVDPMCDAILVTDAPPVGPPRRVWYVEPFGAAGVNGPIVHRLDADGSVHRFDDIARLTIDTPLEAPIDGTPAGPIDWRLAIALPEPPRSFDGLDVGFADNDETFHTQWRRLTPPGAPLTIEARRVDPDRGPPL